MLKDHNLQSFKQENLVREFVGENYRAHDALEDVRALQALFNVLQPTPEFISRHMFTLKDLETQAADQRAPKVSSHRPLRQEFSWTAKVSKSKVKGHESDLKTA